MSDNVINSDAKPMVKKQTENMRVCNKDSRTTTVYYSIGYLSNGAIRDIGPPL